MACFDQCRPAFDAIDICKGQKAADTCYVYVEALRGQSRSEAEADHQQLMAMFALASHLPLSFCHSACCSTASG